MGEDVDDESVVRVYLLSSVVLCLSLWRCLPSSFVLLCVCSVMLYVISTRSSGKKADPDALDRNKTSGCKKRWEKMGKCKKWRTDVAKNRSEPERKARCTFLVADWLQLNDICSFSFASFLFFSSFS